ncbi:Protein IDA-LIKE 2 [Senna tora]|uniref:Protein IDA-LIKE 2 n=1 Tax=Senna tora TaxID=362788 RepID=A0A834X830_9FABA|nr:Protein IDA-LIKE 2 [Senna tora]
MSESCEASRSSTKLFKWNPQSPHTHTGHFYGFLPRRMPIPYSSPSRKHNDIGFRASISSSSSSP